MRITVLAGGVGGAKFLQGVRRFAGTEHSITAIVNTGDDMWLAGLRISPDHDSILYALADQNDTERGWGRRGESERVSAELAAWGVGWPWFTLGDLDLGTHIARSSWLREGVPLHEVVERLGTRWPLGVRMIPATDHEVETWVETEQGPLHFQEWWTRHRATAPALRFVQRGVESSGPAPGVIDAVRDADLVLFAPSNPVVSIGTILGIPGIREAVQTTSAPVVGLSPIIEGAVVRGMADACLTAIGVETSASAVGLHYGARSRTAPGAGVIDGWLVDSADADAVPVLKAAGIRAVATPLWMTDADATAAMVSAALTLVR